MSFRYGFLNSKNGDRKYFASDFSMIFNGLIEDGVFGNVPDGFPVTSTGGMNIAVGKGLAWFSGTWNYIDALYPLTVASADVLYARIDAVVIEVHNDNTVRTNYVKMVKGTPAAEPVPPSMEVEGYTLHPLAYVTVPAGAESISPENIRSVVGTSECPFVVGIQETASVDQLFVQWQAEFDKWFQDLKDNLDENVAANLQNQITTHVTDKTMHIPTLGYFKEGTVHQLTGLLGVSGLASCIFTATDDYMDGDTITVDGEPYAVQLSNGDAAGDRLFVSGVTASVVVDKENKRVNFKAGGGYVKGDVIAAENLKPVTSPFSEVNEMLVAFTKSIDLGYSVGTLHRFWFTEVIDGVPLFVIYKSNNTTVQRFNYEGELVSEEAGYPTRYGYPDVIARTGKLLVLGAAGTGGTGNRNIKAYYRRNDGIWGIAGSADGEPGDSPYRGNALSFTDKHVALVEYSYYSFTAGFASIELTDLENEKNISVDSITNNGSVVYCYVYDDFLIIQYKKDSTSSPYRIRVHSTSTGKKIAEYAESAIDFSGEGYDSFSFLNNPNGVCIVSLYSSSISSPNPGSSNNKAVAQFDPVNKKLVKYFTKSCGCDLSRLTRISGTNSLWAVAPVFVDSVGRRCVVQVDDNYEMVSYNAIPTSGVYASDFEKNLPYMDVDTRMTYPIIIAGGDKMAYAQAFETSETADILYIGNPEYEVLEVSK